MLKKMISSIKNKKFVEKRGNTSKVEIDATFAQPPQKCAGTICNKYRTQSFKLAKKWNYGSSKLESYYSTYQSKNVRPDLRVDMFLFLWGNIHPFLTLNFSQ